MTETDEQGFPPTGRLWEAFVVEPSRGLRAGASRSHGVARGSGRTTPRKENEKKETKENEGPGRRRSDPGRRRKDRDFVKPGGRSGSETCPGPAQLPLAPVPMRPGTVTGA
ncbi:hypothetical protein OHS59_15750 [Streptomyces sp. NBC_00414]|uniref:hypothetical protein n=1 Tax=Streptomyces sp. NBC_00414 TaxID=2975739 RepID=UPI002E1DDB20